jgi:hypothetical protein
VHRRALRMQAAEEAAAVFERALGGAHECTKLATAQARADAAVVTTGLALSVVVAISDVVADAVRRLMHCVLSRRLRMRSAAQLLLRRRRRQQRRRRSGGR